MKRMLLSMSLLALALAPLRGAAEDKSPAGTVISVSGKVALYTGGGDSSASLKPGQAVFAGDRIKTGANGRSQVILADGTSLKISYLTDIRLQGADTKGKASERGIGSIKVALGSLWAKVTKKNSRLEFETPSGVAAVKGTEPGFEVAENGDACIYLLSGALGFSAGASAVEMGPKQMICVKKGTAFSQANVQSWDGKVKDAAAAANSAVIELKATDVDGQDKRVEIEYSPK